MKTKFIEAHERFMVAIQWVGPDFRPGDNRVLVDTGYDVPDPPPTSAEMQQVAFAAKMAMYKVLKARGKGTVT